MVKSFPGYWPPQKPFSEERDRWVLWLPVLFGIVISIYFDLKIEPPLWMGPLAVVMVALTGYAVNLINRDHGSGPAALLIAVAVIAAGFGVAQWRTAAVNAPILIERIGPTAVTGRVSKVETFPSGSRITLERPRIAGLLPNKVPEKIRIRLRGE